MALHPRPVELLKASLLQTKGWLAALPAESRDLFLSVAVARSSPPGQSLLHSGDEQGGMIGIVSGIVEIRPGNAPVEGSFFYRHHPGAWLGYGPLLGRPRTLDALALTHVECLLLPQRPMRALLQDHPQLWRHIAEIAFDDMNAAIAGCADILQHDPLKRLAAMLLWLTGSRHHDRPDTEAAMVMLTHIELADLLGLSRSGVAPLLAEMQRRGCIQKNYGSIRVTNFAALRDIAEA